MAAGNIGGSSNDSTGTTVVRRAIMDRIDDAMDRIEELKIKQQEISDELKALQIQLTIQRQEREVVILQTKLRSLGKAYRAPLNNSSF